MTIALIIAGVIAGIYLYAAVSFYYGFKNWNPMCGCTSSTCKPDTIAGIGDRVRTLR